MQRFGEKLRYLREKQGLTVRQLASVLDIKSAGHITKLEKGQKKPSVDLLVRITLFFNVSSDQLILDNLDLD